MAASLTEEELARLEALEAAATPGPLTAMLPNRAIVKDGALVVRFQLCAAADAELFVAARNALPALLKAARAVRNVEALRKQLENHAYHMATDYERGAADVALLVLEALTATAEPTDGEER